MKALLLVLLILALPASAAHDPDVYAIGQVEQDGSDVAFYRTFRSYDSIHNRLDLKSFALIYNGSTAINCNSLSRFSQIANQSGWGLMKTVGMDTYRRDPALFNTKIEWGPRLERYHKAPGLCHCYCSAIAPDSAFGSSASVPGFSWFLKKEVEDDAFMNCAVVSPGEEVDPPPQPDLIPWWLQQSSF